MPFFVLANPRSGSSMFRLMLNAHSNITVPPESGFALWYADMYYGLDRYDQKVYESFADDVFRAKKFDMWGVSRDQLLKAIIKNKPKSYIGMVDSIYEAYARVKGKESTIFGDKNNYYIEHIDLIEKYFPDSKMIFLFRDGRDVVVSYKNIDQGTINSNYAPKLSKDVEVIAKEWSDNVRKFLSVIERNANTIAVKYEELIANPKSELSRVLNFLGERFEEKTLRFHEFNDEPKEFLQWKSKTLEGVDAQNVNKYKKYLNSQEVKKFNRIAERELLALEYEID